jgi:hypothetical protein
MDVNINETEVVFSSRIRNLPVLYHKLCEFRISHADSVKDLQVPTDPKLHAIFSQGIRLL